MGLASQIRERTQPLAEYNAKYGTNASDLYGNGIASKGSQIWYKGTPYQNLGLEDLGKVLNYLNSYSGPIKGVANATKGHAMGFAAAVAPVFNQRKSEAALAEYQAAQMDYMRQQEFYQAQMAEYQAQMNAYLDKMSEAMAAEEPSAEPLKAAAEVQSAARADTSRKQLLRRGLMSTMTRYGGNGQQQKLGA